MRIGITCYPVAGGSGIVATELGMQLAARDHDIHFVSYALPFRLDRYRPNIKYHGVQTTAYPLMQAPPYTLTLAGKMADVVRSFDLELLHVHYAVPHATSAYLAREILRSTGDRVPKIITTLHGTDITLVGADPSFYDITRFSINTSDGLTAVSKYLADETVDVFRVSKEVRVVHNFFDATRFKPSTSDCTRSEFADESEALIIHVSNFRPVKRTLDVVDIFDRIQQQQPAKLILIGEGPELTLTRRNIVKRGIQDRVIFLGNQSQVEAVLPCCDLFLCPSEEESFGLAALEAQACGVPVIGTSGTGLSEVIAHGETGYLHPVGETREMAESGLGLLRDPVRLQQFKDRSVSRANQRFATERLVGEYESYYEEILNG